MPFLTTSKIVEDEISDPNPAPSIFALKDVLLSFNKIRLFTLALVAGTLVFCVYTTFLWTSGFTPLAQRSQEALSLWSSSGQRRQNCHDPYRRPGYLSVGHGEDYRDTQWIPYTKDFWSMPDPPSAKYPPDNVEATGHIWFDETSEPELQFLNGPFTPKQWMAAAVEEELRRYLVLGNPQMATSASNFVEERDGGGLGWLWGRVVLLASDSIDRFMVEYFCKEFHGAQYQAYGTHTTASCFVPAFNLTLVHWHGVGMPTYKLEPFWDAPTTYVPWEMRYEHVWSNTFPMLTGIDGDGPDLILWQSTLWDRKDFAEIGRERYGVNSSMSTDRRQAVWDELRFYAARAQKMLRFLRERFGSRVPLMLRAVTLHRTDPQYDLMLYDLDRLARGMAEQFDMEVFEWGRIISGHHDFYHDIFHLTHGPASWLWANMILEYLARSAGAGKKLSGRTSNMVPKERTTYFSGWQACNPDLVEWGGR